MSRFLITSALPYINGVKHLGNLAGSMLPADVHARFRRLQGHEVLFICATDEHGTPAELSAAEAQMPTNAYCAQQHNIQRSIYENFKLSFDWFGRSSSPTNHKLTQHFCDRLEDAGLIEERMSKQIFSIDEKRFLPDRYVEGICPMCSYEKARGDQCDNCGTLLDPIQLKNPRSKISGSTNLEARETAHLFLLQSKMAGRLRERVEQNDTWPPLARSIALKWLNEGLHDRAITRDLSWGIPVTRNGKQRPGFENKVFYVWFDAPIAYISATIEWGENTGTDWKRWWRLDGGANDVTYLQFMGKDNVAFHTISFPTTLLGSGEPWKLVDQLKAFNWVTWYGGKFSTSQKRGVFMDKALEILPADYWRWRLMSNAPESTDAPFTWEDFRNSINADLVNVFGNLINRVMKFTETRFESCVPDGGEPGELEGKLASQLDELLQSLTARHEAMEFRKAAAETRAIWVICNEYLQNASPWKLIKTNPVAAAMTIRTALNLCNLCATISSPFIPDAAGKIHDALNVSRTQAWPIKSAKELLDALPRNAAVQSLELLFARINEDAVAEWSTIFGGASGIPGEQAG